jgi:hypothetical protein
MAATSAQSLFTAAGCLSCLGPVDAAQTMRLGLLLNILETLGVDTMTPQELMTESACFACLPGVSQGDAIELALLDQISQNIGGGGGSGAFAGVGSPEGVVTAPPGATYLDTANGAFYAKQTGILNTGWLPLIQ